MPNSLNYLGGGTGARPEKPKDYFQKIDDVKKQNATKVQGNIRGREIEKPAGVSDFAKIVQKNKNNNLSAKISDNKPLTDSKEAFKDLVREKLNKESSSGKPVAGENGTDLALKKLAVDFEKQVLGIMWNLAFAADERDYQGGLGEEIFHKELVNELVKYSKTGEMGDIARSIYNDMSKQNKQQSEAQKEAN